MKALKKIGILILIIITAMGLSCSGRRSLKLKKHREHKVPFYTYSDNLPVFLSSLFEYENPYDPERVKYFATHFLLGEMTESEEIDPGLIKRLNNLDVNENSDSIDAIFNIAFKDLDTEPGPPNEFIEIEMSRRVDYILDLGIFHAGWQSPFDQLGKDIIRMGIPDLERFGQTSFSFYFPLSGIARYYEFHEQDGYIAQSPPVEITQDGDTLTTDKRYYKPGNKLLQEEMESIVGKIYSVTPYIQLEKILIHPFIFPTGQSGIWDGYSDYGAQPWHFRQAGIDIFGDLDDVINKNSFGKTDIDLIVKYVIYNPLNKKIIDSDSLRYCRVINNNNISKGFHIRLFTKRFHERKLSKSNGYSSYILDVSVQTADKKSGKLNYKSKRKSNSFHYILPNDTSQVPVYNLMLVSQNRVEKNQPFNSFYNILNFKPDNTMKRGDSIDIWLPITDLPFDTMDNVYTGNVDFLLKRKSRYETKAEIKEESIRFGPPGDTSISIFNIVVDDSIDFEYSESLVTSTIVSQIPNLYYHTNIKIPENISQGEDYLLMAFVYYRDRSTESIKTINTAFSQVKIK